MSPTLESDLALIFQPQNPDAYIRFEFHYHRIRSTCEHYSEWCRNDRQSIFVLATNWPHTQSC